MQGCHGLRRRDVQWLCHRQGLWRLLPVVFGHLDADMIHSMKMALEDYFAPA
jgi:hypothetical protein